MWKLYNKVRFPFIENGFWMSSVRFYFNLPQTNTVSEKIEFLCESFTLKFLFSFMYLYNVWGVYLRASNDNQFPYFTYANTRKSLFPRFIICNSRTHILLFIIVIIPDQNQSFMRAVWYTLMAKLAPELVHSSCGFFLCVFVCTLCKCISGTWFYAKTYSSKIYSLRASAISLYYSVIIIVRLL